MNYKKRRKLKKGISLVDTVAASVILLVIVIGTLQYRYYATLDIQKAKKHLDATELAVAMSQSWHGVDGIETFDPVTSFGSELTIESGIGPTPPDGYTLLSQYNVVMNDTAYHLTMSYLDFNASLRYLNVIVSWPFGGNDEEKTFSVTNYVYKE